MGGRGASYGVSAIAAISPVGISRDKVQRIHVIAGMTPEERAFVNEQTTLDFLEAKKLSYDKEQLQILDQYGFVTTAYQGNEESVGVDSYGLKQMRGNVVTHNHPGVYGGTFSEADIATLACGMTELRASAVEGSYSMKATKTADPQSFHKAYVRAAPEIQRQMSAIAEANGRKRYKSYEAYVEDNRRTQIAVIHQWYEKNAERYGYKYTFEAREGTETPPSVRNGGESPSSTGKASTESRKTRMRENIISEPPWLETLRGFANKKQMPTSIAGPRADQALVFEWIDKIYPMPQVKTRRIEIGDESVWVDFGNSVKRSTYPSGSAASEQEKRGVLKWLLWEKGKEVAHDTSHVRERTEET